MHSGGIAYVRQRLEKLIAAATAELEQLRLLCRHFNTRREETSSSILQRRWVECACPDCGKQWQEDDS